jgi:intracellular multiplication protein IcmK
MEKNGDFAEDLGYNGKRRELVKTVKHFMPRINLALLLPMLLAATTAAAQPATGKESETLDAFRQKIAQSRAAVPEELPATRYGITGNGAAPAKPAAAIPFVPVVAAPAPAAPPANPANPLAPANPLGPAAALPLKAPATAAALSAAPGAPGGAASPEDLKARMAKEATDQQRQLEQQTFDAAVRQMMPLREDQIRELYERFISNRRAAETPVRVPESKMRVETVSLEPNTAPPVIHLCPGYVSTISIMDASGAPWPVQDISYAGDFTVTPPENGGNVMRITPGSAHGRGNMSVRLVDLLTPVVFTLETDIESVDYRYEARIAKSGPLAKSSSIDAAYGGLDAVAGTDGNLAAFLDGAPPEDAEKLRVSGADGRTAAWKMGDRVYLRTPLALLSPAWESSVSSSDGTTVYSLNDAPVVLLSDEGRMVRARINTASEVSP